MSVCACVCMCVSLCVCVKDLERSSPTTEADESSGDLLREVTK